MDTTRRRGQGLDRGAERGRSPAEDPPDGLLRDQDHGGGRPARRARRRAAARSKKGQTFTIGGVSSKMLCTFTRQFSTLQDAGLPVLRSLQHPRRPDEAGRAQERPDRRGRRHRIRQHAVARRSPSIPSASTASTSTWSRPARRAVPWKSSSSAWPSSRRSRRASSARSTAPWSTRSWSSSVAVGILTFIMIYIIPKFEKIFKDFDMKLPALTEFLMAIVATGSPTTGTSCRCSRCASGCCSS